MVLMETAAVFSGLKGLFMYNRQSYSFNKELNQERLYHLQKMRIEQVKLFREDLRDLFGLTIGKMDNYYMINTLALGFSLGFYYEGKLPSNVPAWLFWLWAMSLATAILFLFLSVWFAIHASVTAQTFQVRLLTQWLRLPVPGIEQINAGAAKLGNFEVAPIKEVLRMPFLSHAVNKELSVGRTTSVRDPPVTADPLLQEGYSYYMGHFYMYMRLQHHWQSLDAYSRACMVVGSNQILNTVIYTGLAYFLLAQEQWGTMAFVVVPIIFALIHAHMNLLLSLKERVFFLSAHTSGPVLATVIASIQTKYNAINEASTGSNIALWASPFCYALHVLAVGFLIILGLTRTNGLPTKFTTVVSIDVLGLPAESEDGAEGETLEGGVGAPGHSSVGPEKSGRQSRRRSSSAGGYLSAVKREPPVKDVVPRAPAVTAASKLYNRLVRRQTVGVATSSRRSRTMSVDAVIPQIIDESIPRVQLESVKQPSGSSRGLYPPPPTAPKEETVGEMPFKAFKLAGLAVILLWIAGIIFSAVLIPGNLDLGWDNTLDPGDPLFNNSAKRRLGQLPDMFNLLAHPPGLFMDVGLVTCSCDRNATVVLQIDSLNDNERSFILERTRNDVQWRRCQDFPCASNKSDKSQFVVDRRVEVKPQCEGDASLTVWIPALYETNFTVENIAGFVTTNKYVVGASKTLSNQVLVWNRTNAQFVGTRNLLLPSHAFSAVAGLCNVGTTEEVVYVVSRQGSVIALGL